MTTGFNVGIVFAILVGLWISIEVYAYNYDLGEGETYVLLLFRGLGIAGAIFGVLYPFIWSFTQERPEPETVQIHRVQEYDLEKNETLYIGFDGANHAYYFISTGDWTELKTSDFITIKKDEVAQGIAKNIDMER